MKNALLFVVSALVLLLVGALWLDAHPPQATAPSATARATTDEPADSSAAPARKRTLTQRTTRAARAGGHAVANGARAVGRFLSRPLKGKKQDGAKDDEE